MNTFYSILSLTLNAAIDDRVSIGLFMSDKERYFFNYSQSKLAGLKGIIGDDKYFFANQYLQSLVTKEPGSLKENFLDSKLPKEHWANESYVGYLSRYSNNLIRFSTPKEIDLEVTEPIFNKLFEKYIFLIPKEPIKKKDENILHQIKKSLFPKIKEKVNIEILLDKTNFTNLVVPITVDFIGKNHVPVTGQIFDFTKNNYNLENDLARYISLTRAIDLENGSNPISAKYFIVGQEPSKKELPKNHQLWKQVKETKGLEFVDKKEIEIIEDYIKTKGVERYFS